jgi:RecJ-like exonuclease
MGNLLDVDGYGRDGNCKRCGAKDNIQKNNKCLDCQGKTSKIHKCGNCGSMINRYQKHFDKCTICRYRDQIEERERMERDIRVNNQAKKDNEYVMCPGCSSSTKRSKIFKKNGKTVCSFCQYH